MTYPGRVEDPPGSGLFYLKADDLVLTDTAGMVEVDVDDEPAVLLPAELPGLYIVSSSSTEGTYLPTYDPAHLPAWSVDLCAGWQRIGTASAFVFAGVLRVNDPGDWVLEVPASAVSWSDGAAAVDVDTIRVVDGDGVVRYPGVVTADGGGAGGYTVTKEGGGATLRWAGNDLWEYARRRLAFPDPMDGTPGWTVSHDVRTGPAAEVLAGYILENLGASAITGRRIAGFGIDTPGGGISDTWEARLQPLSDLVKKVCSDGGVVCRFDYSDGAPVARIYPPADWSDSYILSDKGDLSRIEVRHQPKAATWTIAAGSGEGVNRLFQLSNFGGSGMDRIESFSDQSSIGTTTPLYAAAYNHNIEHAAQMFVTVDVADDAADRVPFGTVVSIGDLIGIEVDEVRYVVPVTELRYEVNAQHQRVLPTLGTATPDALTGLIKDVANLTSRFGQDIA